MSVSKSFTAVGSSDTEGVRYGDHISYAASGTFSATWSLKYTKNNGQTWIEIATGTGASSGVWKNQTGDGAHIKFECTAYTSGTLVTAITSGAQVGPGLEDDAGNVRAYVTEDGLSVVGDLAVSEDVAVTGNASVTGTLSATGAATLDGGAAIDGTVTLESGATAAETALRISLDGTEGTLIKVIDETVSLAAAGATSKALTNAVPVGAVILSVQSQITVLAVAGGTSVKVGIGLAAGDVDKYGLSADLAKNTKTNVIPDWAVLSGAETLAVCAVTSDGSALGDTNWSAGSVRVRIVYLDLTALTNVA